MCGMRVVPRSSWDEALATALVLVCVRCGTMTLSWVVPGGNCLCRVCPLLVRWWRQCGDVVL